MLVYAVGPDVYESVLARSRPRPVTQWAPEFQRKEQELRRLYKAAIAFETPDWFGYDMPDVERRVRGLKEACLRLLLWERDAPRVSPKQWRRRQVWWDGSGPDRDYIDRAIDDFWRVVQDLEPLALRLEGGPEGGRCMTSGSKRAPKGERPRLPLDRYAVAIEHGKAVHVFTFFGTEEKGQWQHRGQLKPPLSPGAEYDLFELFVKSGGGLKKDAAVKSFRKTVSSDEKAKIYQAQVKPVLSRIRTKLRESLGLGKIDPIPWDKPTRSYIARIQVGYAIQDDQGKLCFRRVEDMTNDDILDRTGHVLDQTDGAD
jgi:hypothetical protein